MLIRILQQKAPVIPLKAVLGSSFIYLSALADIIREETSSSVIADLPDGSPASQVSDRSEPYLSALQPVQP